MKSIPLVLMLVIYTGLFSQQTTDMHSKDYLKKSKNQKVAAWSLLGGGIIMSSIGTVVALKETVKIPFIPFPGSLPPDEKKLNGGAILMIAGGTAVLGSIPLFIAASRNKRKVVSVALKNEQVPHIYEGSLVYRSIPSLSLKFKL